MAKEHIQNIIPNIFVKEKEKQAEENELDDTESKDNFDQSTEFRCFKCKDIVLLEDKFNCDLEEDQMCKLCTMTEDYTVINRVTWSSLETASHRFCEREEHTFHSNMKGLQA